MKQSNTSERLKQILNETGMKQVDILERAKPFCEKYNVRLGRNDLSQYVSGKVEPGQEKLTMLAMALNINEAWLMGYDVPMERATNTSTNHPSSAPTCSNLVSLKESNFKKVPLIGSIACGVPILATENIEEYINMDCGVYADFALRCKGDSMINARIFDGDIVYIRKQPCVENGEIAAVVIDDMECQATLKRVFLDNEKIRLCAENPMYKDLIFFHEEMNTIRIIGKAVAFLSNVK
ncbi:LexA family protein [Anaerotignum sp. MB30-C6]|uniref:LexA family protein n=1 Tax=Anaerotignum sp. MB30-C6 TaxID=3070814 RepID=UPI0027DCEDAC|nr:S24 family peptidase [Anaerotignum sp. MB30-C6]WMI81567.1 S24 family peptidase [Anaerotignum sp. MB30-C6]